MSFFRKHCLCPLLNHIRNAIGLGCTVSHPHLVQIHPSPDQFLRNHGISTPCSCKSCCFGKRTDFNCTLPCAINFKNTVRQAIILNKGFIGSVKKNHCICASRIVHPDLQLFTVKNSTGRIIWGTEINNVSLKRRIRNRQKSVFLSRRKMENPVSCHNIGIHICRIGRLHN